MINFCGGKRESRGRWEGFHLGKEEYVLTRQMRKCLSGGGSRVSKGVGGGRSEREYGTIVCVFGKAQCPILGRGGGWGRLRIFEGCAVELRLDPVNMWSP